MSELRTYDVIMTPSSDGSWVLKSEADKVIAELKKERDWLAKDRAQAYGDLEKRAQLNIKQEESIRHQKYRRCLDMSRWCDTKADWYYSINGFSESFRDRVDFYIKWRDKWRKLAQKFKERI